LKKILFISHDASRTGAPIVLLHLLRWIKLNTDINFSILLKEGGELQEEFTAIAPVYFWKENIEEYSITNKVVSKYYRRVLNKNLNQEKILTAIEFGGFGVIYANTVASHELAVFMKARLKIKLISHIHELPYCINVFYEKQMRKEIVEELDGVIAVSEITRKYLKELYHIPAAKIELFYESIPLHEEATLTKTEAEVRKKLGIESSFVVGGSGAMSWRKGIDLFIALSWTITRKNPSANIAYMWVGAISKEVIEGYHYECTRQGLKEQIIFTGVKTMPQNYFQVMDIFVLPSREDPFPLVCLEAASLGKPIVCFESAGGIPEMLQGGGGFVVPYLDINKMADTILELYENRTLLAEKGKEVRELVKSYDVNIIAPAILKYVLQFN